MSVQQGQQEATVPVRRLWRADLVYSLCLFAVAGAVLFVVLRQTTPLPTEHGWRTALFFVLYALFTIAMGWPHPRFGHVSFDRVAQVASILVLGPVAAAWINGLASFVYPWKRLLAGVSVPAVLTAALHNAGLMTLVILVCGKLYSALGGPIPLLDLGWESLGLLLLLMLSMQLMNDLGMMAVFYIRSDDPTKVFNVFSTTVEVTSGVIAVLVAVIYNRVEPELFVLLLGVLSLGMLTLRQFAHMRYRLEAIVAERTRELSEKSLELERQATHDPLTKLPNRRHVDEFLETELEKARRYGHAFTVAMADVDYFKRINDDYTHALGDEVLRRIAAILKARCRKTDMIARYGGDEFLMCFPQTEQTLAARICEELRAAVETTDWSDIGAPATVTLSIGLAGRRENSSSPSLLREADENLYEAKNRGRNRVVS